MNYYVQPLSKMPSPAVDHYQFILPRRVVPQKALRIQLEMTNALDASQAGVDNLAFVTV